ncbi:MAG: glycosyltransferase N-terminal domain-containing protein [Thermonemataceae bacterium]|nr:glycosyltransferase N-terminal domain-containing protein [Thermonemataceae bacterium]
MFVYNIFLKIYKFLAYILAFMGSTKAKLWRKGQEGIFENLQKYMPCKGQLVWFHCASVGEFEQARPVLEAFKEQYPSFFILLTFFSPSGYELRKNYEYADYVSYLPLDNSKDAKKFLDITKPSIIFWVKYEFWYHFLSKAYQKKIPIILFSAIFREKQLFFKPYGKFYREILSFFSAILVQDENSQKLLANIHIKAEIAYDTRFDRVFQIAEQNRDIHRIEEFRNEEKILILGSAWQQEINLLKNFLQIFKEPLKIIIAPHEINKKEITLLKQELGKEQTILFSEISQEKDISTYTHLIVDNVGYLSALYRYADFAFVGGGFKQGLHNILEPATFALPIFFGNKAYQKFREARELLELQGAFAIADAADFLEKFSKLYHDVQLWQKASEISRNYVKSHLGGTNRVLEQVKTIIF